MNATRSVVGLVWGSMVLAGVACLAGVHVNTTASMPAGLWLQRPYHGAVRDGEAVVVCLPATTEARRYIGPGTCPNGLEPLLKTVGAVAGEVVSLSPGGISVNGRTLADSASLQQDGAGRAITAYPSGVYPVPPGQVWLISTHTPVSYDSRYFGPVGADSIVAIGEPLWTGK